MTVKKFPGAAADATNAAVEALTRLDELHAALSAVAELSSPGHDLKSVSRNNLASLLGLLLRLQSEATESAWVALQSQGLRTEGGSKLASLATALVLAARSKAKQPGSDAP